MLTNFGRWGMPLFRYRTRDRVVATEDRCACGRTTLRLQGGILGRTDDMLVVRGVNVFPSALENIIRGHEAVSEYQIEVRQARGMRELFLRLELTPALDSAEAATAALARVLDDLHRQLQLRPRRRGRARRYPPALRAEGAARGPPRRLIQEPPDASYMIVTICRDGLS